MTVWKRKATTYAGMVLHVVQLYVTDIQYSPFHDTTLHVLIVMQWHGTVLHWMPMTCSEPGWAPSLHTLFLYISSCHPCIIFSGKFLIKLTLYLSNCTRMIFLTDLPPRSGSSQGTGVNNSEVLSKRERITVHNKVNIFICCQFITPDIFTSLSFSFQAKVSIGYKSKPVSKWDTSDVCTWLSDVGLGAHCQVFAENEIMGEHLFDLSREELRDLGISKIGHQKTFRQKLELAINSNNDWVPAICYPFTYTVIY